MKVLSENLNYNIFHDLAKNIGKVASISMLNNDAQVAKALNEVVPDLVILSEENISSTIKAYCNNNNVKLLCFSDKEEGDNYGDLTLHINQDASRANLEVLNFKQDTKKKDISVFINHESQRFLADFLCKNYNVKIYGNVYISNHRYLGIATELEKYEILNRSKFSICFNYKDVYDSILLDTYPIIYSERSHASLPTFNNAVSLVEIMEDELDDGNVYRLKSTLKSDNSLTFTIDVLQQLGFKEEVTKLNSILGGYK